MTENRQDREGHAVPDAEGHAEPECEPEWWKRKRALQKSSASWSSSPCRALPED